MVTISHTSFRLTPRFTFSVEERDDGALSDGGDDMTPEQHGTNTSSFLHSCSLTCPVRLIFSSNGSRSREYPRNSWFRGSIRIYRFIHQRNYLGLLLRRRTDCRVVIGYVLYSSSARMTDISRRGAGEEECRPREK